MAIRHKAIDIFQGKDYKVKIQNIKDVDGNVIDFTGATITYLVTDENGAGNTKVTRTTADTITISTTTFTVKVTASLLTGLTFSEDGTEYWHEIEVDDGTDVYQLLAPSPLVAYSAKS